VLVLRWLPFVDSAFRCPAVPDALPFVVTVHVLRYTLRYVGRLPFLRCTFYVSLPFFGWFRFTFAVLLPFYVVLVRCSVALVTILVAFVLRCYRLPLRSVLVAAALLRWLRLFPFYVCCSFRLFVVRYVIRSLRSSFLPCSCVVVLVCCVPVRCLGYVVLRLLIVRCSTLFVPFCVCSSLLLTWSSLLERFMGVLRLFVGTALFFVCVAGTDVEPLLLFVGSTRIPFTVTVLRSARLVFRFLIFVGWCCSRAVYWVLFCVYIVILPLLRYSLRSSFVPFRRFVCYVAFVTFAFVRLLVSFIHLFVGLVRFRSRLLIR